MSERHAPFVETFQLSVTTALRDQLLDLLNQLEATPLTIGALATLEKRGGVYQLFHDGQLVYVGKSTRDLPGRLLQHHQKLRGRQGDLLSGMTFRCVYVAEDLDAVAPEKLLIGQFRSEGLTAWNTNGFGNKDPGRRRDTSLVKSNHFDRLHPIDLSQRVAGSRSPGIESVSLYRVMQSLKDALPYTFRFSNPKSVDAKLLREIQLPIDEVPFGELTAQEWIEWLVARLPDDWVVVSLPGYVIAYPGLRPDTIPSRTGSWAKVEGEVTFSPHEAVFDSQRVPLEEADTQG